MAENLTPAPDWFDRLWEQNAAKLPLLLRNDSAKQAARGLLGVAFDALGREANTPRGVQTIIAMGKITQILRGTQGVLNSPDPSPEEIAAAVERLVAKVKP